MTELVLATDLVSEQREYLTLVRDASESLLLLINDILDFSKMEAEKMTLEKTPFDLPETVGDVLKTLAVRAHHKSLEVICDIAPDVPPSVLGDPTRLRQVLINLVGNAIKFTEQGEIVVSVNVERRDDDGTYVLQFSVADTGIGIEDEMRAAIFFPFEQADTSTTRKFGGTGLGLAIVSNIVELMGGKISVQSELGKGSTFNFTATFEAAADDPPPPREVMVGGTSVLVVDDNEKSASTIGRMLSNWSMQPTVFHDADAAEQSAFSARENGTPFELAVIDATMPDRDGFSLAEKLQAQVGLQKRIVMMLGAGPPPGEINRCERLGVAAYLAKPVKQSELFDSIVFATGFTVPGDPIPAPVQHTETATRPLKILLAEDSYMNQKLAVALLEREGHHVHVVDNGREAVAALETHVYDLVLMDVQMPEMDGLEATRAIRDSERNSDQHAPIIAMTAHAMPGDREQCLAAGMDAYISKPIRADRLFVTISDLLNESYTSKTASFADAPDSEQVDWALALQSVNGDRELLVDVINAFLEETPRLLEDTARGIEQQDPALLQRSAHTIKGSLRLFGTHIAVEHAFRLETMGKQAEFEHADDCLSELQPMLDSVIEELNQYVNGAKPNADK